MSLILVVLAIPLSFQMSVKEMVDVLAIARDFPNNLSSVTACAVLEIF